MVVLVYVSEDNDLDPDVELGYVWKLKNRIYFNPSARNKIKTIIIDDDTDRGTTAFDAIHIVILILIPWNKLKSI
jgi:hypothetical protein